MYLWQLEEMMPLQGAVAAMMQVAMAAYMAILLHLNDVAGELST